MARISFCILLSLAAFVAVEGYQKSAMGTTCSKRALEIKKESECIQACAALGIQYKGSWDGPDDFPGCTYTEGLNKVCHFNTNKKGRTMNPKYSAICKDCEDVKSAKVCDKQGKKKNKCDKKSWAKRNCMVTCGICDPAKDNLVDNNNNNNNNADDYVKAPKGALCGQYGFTELATEADCRAACADLGYPMDANNPSWNGPGDFPACLYTEGLNKVCHFNTSPNPGRTNVNAQYAAICKA